MIKYFTEVKQKNYSEKNIEELFKYVKNNVDKNPISIYEHYNNDNIQKIKPHFDIDIEIKQKDKTDIITIKNDIVKFLIEHFGKESRFVFSYDDKLFKKKKKGVYPAYFKRKVSIHIIIYNFKIEPNFLKYIISKIKDRSPYPIDTQIYRKGINKFRLPLTNKEEELEIRKDTKKYLKIDEESLEEYKKHCITLVDDLEEYKNEIFFQDYIIFKEKTEKRLKKIEQKEKYGIKNDKILEIINEYESDIFSTTTKNNKLYISLKTKCKIKNDFHNSNNQYLIYNKDNNTLIFKCHDEDCKNKSIVLYKESSEENFDFDFFKKIPLQDQDTENYTSRKEYFDKYHINLLDSGKVYRLEVIEKRTDKGNYYKQTEVKQIEVLRKGSWNSKLCYYEKQDGVIVRQNFFDKWLFDINTNFFYDVTFNPDYSSYNKNDYNLFRGFSYESILDVNQKITQEDNQNLEILLDFIKKYYCEDIEEHFVYLISFFASIIQEPSFLNHIIPLFYSSEEGTGKSSLLKFYSSIIGIIYSYFGQIKQICEKHTSAQFQKLINIIEEIDYENSSRFIETLKNKSQEIYGVYNKKFEQEKTIACYVRYLITSNNSDAIPISPTDRRFIIFHVFKCHDLKLVNKIQSLFSSNKMIYLFGNYLKNYNIPWDIKDRNQWKNKRYLNKVYKSMVKYKPIDKFFISLYNRMSDIEFGYEDNHLEDKKYNLLENRYLVIKNSILFKMYKIWTELVHQKAMAKTNFDKNITLYNFIKRYDGGLKFHSKIDMEGIKENFLIKDNYKDFWIKKVKIEIDEDTDDESEIILVEDDEDI
jgi:hypothetical protein